MPVGSGFCVLRGFATRAAAGVQRSPELVLMTTASRSFCSSRVGRRLVESSISRKQGERLPQLMQDPHFTTPDTPRARQHADLVHLTDEDLLAELRSGNDDAAAVIFERYHRLIYSIAFKIVRDPSEAEDVMQGVLFEIFRSVAQFDPSKGTCKVWLLQYAYHRAINRRQQLNARHFYNLVSMEDAERDMGEQRSAFGRLAQAELKHLMQQGLATLNTIQKRVIELATYQGLSMQEISLRTGESLVNVRHHYYRGLKKLRSFVEDNKQDLQKGAGVGGA